MLPLVELWRLHRLPLLALIWAPLVALLANLSVLGLPDIGMVSNASAIIAGYLPIAMCIGYLGGELVSLAERRLPRLGRAAARWIVALAVVGVGLWGAGEMVSVVNPSTVLATEADLRAAAWIRENTPDDARFLINARHWQRGIYMGPDGGWWLPILADRATTLPAVVYWGGSAEYVAGITEMAEWASTVQDPASPESLARLRGQGVTHIYCGALGGNLAPTRFVGADGVRTIYARDGVWVFEIEQ